MDFREILAIATLFRIELFPYATVFSFNIALYFKDLSALVFRISASKLVASSLE